MSDLFEAAGLAPSAPQVAANRPLADRLRPQTLGEVVGQEHLLGPAGPIGRMAAAGRLSSMILWGPLGVGKTTICGVAVVTRNRWDGSERGPPVPSRGRSAKPTRPDY